MNKKSHPSQTILGGAICLVNNGNLVSKFLSQLLT